MKKALLSLLLILTLAAASLPASLAESAAFDTSDYFSKRDLKGAWDEEEAQEIALSGSLSITQAGT